MIRRITLPAGTVTLSDERPRRADADVPLVLLHGFTGSHASWSTSTTQ